MTSGTVCIVLAGGLGTRLRSVVADLPKCLAPVEGQPFLRRQLESLSARGVERFVLSLGYGSEQVQEALADWPLKNRISCVVETEPLGTGGAMAFALRESGLSEALVANGDTFLGGDLQALLTPLRADEAVRMSVVTVPDRARFGGVAIDAEGRVERFIEKGAQGPGPINAGLYRVGTAAFEDAPKGAFSFETETMPRLVAEARLRAALIHGDFIDIGVPEDYHRYCRDHERLR